MTITPKEKAKKLFNNYVNLLPYGSNVERAKQCALLAVEEIIDELVDIDDGQTTMPYKYWQNVINEIKLL